MVLPKGTWTVFQHPTEQHIGAIDDILTGADDQEAARILDVTLQLHLSGWERSIV